MKIKLTESAPQTDKKKMQNFFAVFCAWQATSLQHPRQLHLSATRMRMRMGEADADVLLISQPVAYNCICILFPFYCTCRPT